MKHITEEELILYYYGETSDLAGLEQHLSACESCRAGYRALQLVLNTVDSMPVPERPADYGEQVWQRLSPRLRLSPSRRVLWPRWAVAGAMAILLVLAFLAGRLSPRKETHVATDTGQVRERILMVAVGDHLERSQMVLIELVNAQTPGATGKVDISEEQRWAQELVETNRLYRQTASTAGESGLVAVLEDLERVLLDIVHGDSQLSSQELEEMRRRIEAQGLLFKVRVIGSQLRERETAPRTTRTRTSL